MACRVLRDTSVDALHTVTQHNQIIDVQAYLVRVQLKDEHELYIHMSRPA
jgi:hypothetical protein